LGALGQHVPLALLANSFDAAMKWMLVCVVLHHPPFSAAEEEKIFDAVGGTLTPWLKMCGEVEPVLSYPSLAVCKKNLPAAYEMGRLYQGKYFKAYCKRAKDGHISERHARP
jgi:hypothetical protein